MVTARTVPPGLTIKIDAFCLQNKFMYILCISEQTAIISLYSINWLVFITETDSVYCAVRTGSLNTIQNNFSLLALWVVPWFRRLVTGLPLRRPWFDARPAYVRFVVAMWHWDRHFSQYLSCTLSVSFPQRSIPPSTCRCHQDKRAVWEPANRQLS